MPYERLSGQVVKAEITNKQENYFDFMTGQFVMKPYEPVANITLSLDDGNRIFLTIPPEDSGAWIGKKVNVVITTKEER